MVFYMILNLIQILIIIEGALIPKDIVDNVYYDIITANYDSIDLF